MIRVEAKTVQKNKNINSSLEIYQKLKREREQQETPGVFRRLRLSRDMDGNPVVDLSKADKDCEYCKGTGRLEDIWVGEGDDTQVIPVVCRCVKKNGGVKDDLLDRIMKGTHDGSKPAEN
jgi:hypothetical protein